MIIFLNAVISGGFKSREYQGYLTRPLQFPHHHD